MKCSISKIGMLGMLGMFELMFVGTCTIRWFELMFVGNCVPFVGLSLCSLETVYRSSIESGMFDMFGMFCMFVPLRLITMTWQPTTVE